MGILGSAKMMTEAIEAKWKRMPNDLVRGSLLFELGFVGFNPGLSVFD